jgi:cytochrome P450
MVPTTSLPPKFDPYDPAVLDNPYPTYARLRHAGPLCRGGPAQWVVPRYADVARLICDPRLSSRYGSEYHRIAVGDGPLTDFFEHIVLNRDPPGHTRLRRLLGQAFTPAAVRSLTSSIGTLVDELLAPGLDRGRLDAVVDLADRLPIRVLAEVVGIDLDCIDEVRPRAIALARAFATFLPENDRATSHAAVTWLRDLMSGLLERRRRSPSNDLISRLATVQCDNESMTTEELVDNVVFLLFAGFSTTTDLLSTGCAALLAHPHQLARLRAHPALVPAAVEEFLRYDAPVQLKSRVVMNSLEIGGRTIRPGRILLLLLGSANHDEDRFRYPDVLDIGRDPNPHLSFGGGGIHHCLGAPLARAEATAVFGRLVRKFSTIEPDGPTVRRPSASFRSFASIPMRMTAA